MTVKLLDYQVDAIKQLDTGKILVGDVGTGKSITSMSYFTQRHPGRDIYVITTAKKRDSGEWLADALKISLNHELVVDSWNNIKKYQDVKGACFIFDEQRILGNGAWVEAFYQIAKNNDWILLSATPADTWVDLVPVFVANGYYKNRTEFNHNHVIWSRFAKFPKIDRYFDTDILDRYAKNLYVLMETERHTVPHDHIIKVDYDREEEIRIYRDRWNIYDDVPIKDVGEMIRLLRKSTNAHWSRYEAIKTLAKDNPRLIVFYNHNPELETLRLLHTDLDIPVAEWNGHYHQPIPEGDRWIYLVQYEAGSEGWNCITTDAIAFYSLPYAYRRLHQAKGRINRMNTPYTDLHYYILRSNSIVDSMIWKAVGRKKNFNVSRFARKIWPEEQEKRRLN